MGGPGAYTLGVALFAAIGTFLFVSMLVSHDCFRTDVLRMKGFDTGIATTS